MYKLKNVPLTISGILKDAWALYKPSFIPLLPSAIIISIIHIVPFLYGFVGFYEVSAKGHLVFSWLALMIYVGLLIVEAYFVGVLLYTAQLIATEQKLNHKVIFGYAKSQIFTLYFALLLYFLAINIGVFLLILPGIFIAILFSMFLPFIIIERQGIFPSFESSARLVWGYWWQTFFVIVIPYLLSYLLRNFVRFTPWTSQVWLLLIDAFILSLFIPYFYAILLVQFHNLKLIKSLPSPTSDRPRLQS
jgi:hypothetical protein